MQLDTHQDKARRQLNKLIHRMREFSRATGKDESAVVSRSAKRVAIFVSAKTNKSSREKILGEMSRPLHNSSRLRTIKSGKNKGKFRRSNRWKGTAASAIYAFWQKRRGGDTQTRFYRGVQKMVSRRLAAVSYWKSGWIPALKTFGAAKTAGSRPIRTRKIRIPPGRAIMRKRVPSRGASAIFSNYANDLAHKQPEIVAAALADRVHELDRDMADQVRKRAKQAGFKVK